MEEQEMQEQAAEAPVQSAEKSKSSLKIFGILGVLLVCLVAGVAGASIFVGKVFPGEAKPAAAEKAEEPATIQDDTGTKVLFEMPSLIVNVSGTDCRRYLKVNIPLALSNAKLKKQLEDPDTPEVMIRLKDSLIALLSSKKLEDLDGIGKKNALRREIKDTLNMRLGLKNGITEVYFTEFIVQ